MVSPKVGPDEVLVKLKAIGVNYFDIYIRQGLRKVKAYPYIPGQEGSGEIIQLGKNVSRYKLGDRVAFCKSISGSYMCVVKFWTKKFIHVTTGLWPFLKVFRYRAQLSLI